MRVYIRQGENQLGPFPVEQVKQYVAVEQIRLSDMACVEGTTIWQTVEAILNTPSPLPPPFTSFPQPAPATRTTAGLYPPYPAAPFMRRIGAYLLDNLLLACLAFPGGVILGWQQAADPNAPPILGWCVLGIGVLGGLYYMFARDSWSVGAGWGKRKMRLMVVNTETNTPCSLGASIIRFLILAILGIIPLAGYMLELVVALASKDGRRLGDRAAKTQVIDVANYRPTHQ